MEIVTKAISELRPMEKNIRRHPEKQIKEYVRSLKMFEQIKPIVVDETGQILVGNGLFEALKSMGATECACIVKSNLSEKQKKKLMLADNRVYELGFTDTQIFDDIIKELDGDVDVPGWDEDLLEMLNSSVRETNEMVESYGVFSADERATVNDTERIDHSEHRIAAAETTPATVAQEDVAAESSENNEAVVEKTIICPHCGERICL